jgi:hypothetical protein
MTCCHDDTMIYLMPEAYITKPRRWVVVLKAANCYSLGLTAFLPLANVKDES